MKRKSPQNDSATTPSDKGDSTASAKSPFAFEPEAKDLVDTAAASGHFGTLHRALRSTGLSKILRSKGPFTLFAPTDQAFARIPEAEREKLFTDRAALTRVLRYHVVREKVRAPRVGVPRAAKTIEGQSVELTKADGRYRINSARILKTGITASNGVIHAINAVLVPR
jgi:uncharacterized surface protein with fasciclin (FAS1) repeats